MPPPTVLPPRPLSCSPPRLQAAELEALERKQAKELEERQKADEERRRREREAAERQEEEAELARERLRVERVLQKHGVHPSSCPAAPRASGASAVGSGADEGGHDEADEWFYVDHLGERAGSRPSSSRLAARL